MKSQFQKSHWWGVHQIFQYPDQGCQTHFHWEPHQPRGCLQRAEIIVGLYKCNCSLTVTELKLHLALRKQQRG